MMVKWAVPLLCLLLLGGALGQERKITDEQKKVMRRGIAAGQRLTQLLQTGNLRTALAQADTFVAPWMEAIDTVFDFVGSLFPDTDELILEEIIKGFQQVNARLDVIIRELGEIKKIIEWKDMQVRFGDIEYRIRLLDTTLKDTLRSPNRKDGVNRYKNIFNAEYRNAGFALYDSVANNDQVFNRNLLTAAMKFSENTRRQTQKFSKGLFGLLLKATSAEVAFEKFSRTNTGQKDIWRGRLTRCRIAMEAADTALETENWKAQFKTDSEKTLQAQNGKSHTEFSKKLYDFLADKYYWRYWFVMAYDEVEGYYHHGSKLPSHGYRSFRKWGRNLIVVSTDPKSSWDLKRAQSYIHHYTCRALPHQCHKDTGKWVLDLSPDYGVAKMVVQAWKAPSMAINCYNGRYARGRIRLLRPTGGWYNRFDLVYFG